MKEVNNSSFKGINILNNKKNIRRFFVLDGCYSYPWDEFFIRTSWDVSSYKPTHLFSDGPRRCIRRTTRDCRPYRSFLLESWFGRSGSSGFVGGFHRLRLSNRESVLKARRNPDWCRYRYICRPVGLPATSRTNPVFSSMPSEASPSFRRPLSILLSKAS